MFSGRGSSPTLTPPPPLAGGRLPVAAARPGQTTSTRDAARPPVGQRALQPASQTEKRQVTELFPLRGVRGVVEDRLRSLRASEPHMGDLPRNIPRGPVRRRREAQTHSNSQASIGEQTWAHLGPLIVTGVDDEDADGDVAFQLRVTLTSDAPADATLGSGELAARNLDNEHAYEPRTWYANLDHACEPRTWYADRDTGPARSARPRERGRSTPARARRAARHFV